MLKESNSLIVKLDKRIPDSNEKLFNLLEEEILKKSEKLPIKNLMEAVDLFLKKTFSKIVKKQNEVYTSTTS
ncbi:MAG: hypothetical protein HC906_04300 [Bacteroidales bacterium]|nr:hypothetical protein [Bacteroidales bacterium]